MRYQTTSFGLALLLGAALLGPLSAKDAKEQGFAGKWALDKKASHGSEQLDDLRQNIKHNGNEYVIQSQFPEPKNAIAPMLYLGVMTSSFRITTDGQEITQQVGPYMVVSKTTMDGSKMVTEWHSTINGDPVQGKWVHSLSDDGKMMTIELTESSTHGQKGDATLVMKRK